MNFEIDQIERMVHDRTTELSAFLQEINRESDRGMVLVGLSSIDDRLRATLAAFMCSGRQTDELLSGANAALGTLSSRSAACLALGLIEKLEFDEINILRKIRNEFAHGLVSARFADPRIEALCNSLKSPLPEFVPKQQQTTRFKFSNAVTSIMTRILYRPEWVARDRRQPRQWVDPESIRWRSFSDEQPPAGSLALTLGGDRFAIQATEPTTRSLNESG